MVGERVVKADFHEAEVGSQKLEVRSQRRFSYSSLSLHSGFWGPKERRLYLRVEGKQTALTESVGQFPIFLSGVTRRSSVRLESNIVFSSWEVARAAAVTQTKTPTASATADE